MSLSLEEQLAEANRKLEKVARCVEIAEQMTDAQTDKQVELAATFQEAMAYVLLNEAEKDRDTAIALLRAIQQEDIAALKGLEEILGEVPALSPASRARDAFLIDYDKRNP